MGGEARWRSILNINRGWGQSDGYQVFGRREEGGIGGYGCFLYRVQVGVVKPSFLDYLRYGFDRVLLDIGRIITLAPGFVLDYTYIIFALTVMQVDRQIISLVCLDDYLGICTQFSRVHLNPIPSDGSREIKLERINSNTFKQKSTAAG